MNSKIIKLADLGQFVVDEADRDRTVSEETLEAAVISLSENLGEEAEAEVVAGDCCVLCEKEDGTPVAVFPAMEIPGAEAAGAALMGHACGDRVATALLGLPTVLCITKILVQHPAPIDDSLALRAALPGVETLAQLKAHLRAEAVRKLSNAAEKHVTNAMLEYLETKSTATLDENELETWSRTHAEEAYRENLAAGIDLRFTETGDMLTEAEAIAQLTEDMKRQFKLKLVIDCCCEQWGYVEEPEAYLAMLPPEMLEIPGMEPDPALLEQLKENDRYMFVLDTLTQKAKEVLS